MTENTKTLLCKKLGEELPALEKAPFPGELGEEILNTISAKAWDMWANDMQVKVLNEYRLNMAEKKDYEVLIQQMKAFLNLSDQETLEVENADRGMQKNS